VIHIVATVTIIFVRKSRSKCALVTRRIAEAHAQHFRPKPRDIGADIRPTRTNQPRQVSGTCARQGRTTNDRPKQPLKRWSTVFFAIRLLVRVLTISTWSFCLSLRPFSLNGTPPAAGLQQCRQCLAYVYSRSSRYQQVPLLEEHVAAYPNDTVARSMLAIA
jgi:hypothetical protein